MKISSVWLTFFKRRHKLDPSKQPWRPVSYLVVAMHIDQASDTGRSQ